jgi:uncharacterized protein (TIGR02145 family)
MKLIPNFSLFIVLVCVAVNLIIPSCKKDTLMPTYTDQGNIGPEGGIVRTSDGASVEIPAGLLSSEKTISLTNVTQTDTVANAGCKIYEIKPDGLMFSDSVILSFPFNNDYIDLNSKKENYGVGIMVFQGTEFIKLKASVDLQNKTISAKTTHFSTYTIYYPSIYSQYYKTNKLETGKTCSVPHYWQYQSNWCAYYSLSMITKYAGYYYKAPELASLLGETSYDGILSGLNDIYQDPFVDDKLTEIGITAERAFPPWINAEELGGYILMNLDDGNPVWVNNIFLRHVIVITGHSPNGFFINDPSGYLLEKVFDVVPWPDNRLTNIFISYDQFEKIFNGIATTLVIKSAINNSRSAVSINFPPGAANILIGNISGSEVGKLEINGKYKPNGYSLINNANKDNSFNGSDFVWISPLFSNSNIVATTVNLHYMIDGNDISGSPIKVEIPAKTTNFYSDENLSHTYIKFQLSNLLSGSHNLRVELRSNNDDVLDYWDFPFNILSEYTLPSTIVNPISSYTQTTAISGGYISSDGGSSIISRGVCWSTSENPTIANEHSSDGQGTGRYTSNLTGLRPGTKYYVRAYATNSVGTGYSSNQISFTTQPANLSGSFIDSRDGKVYKTIIIGTQTWMTENLAYLPTVSPSSMGSYSSPYYYVNGYQGTNISAAKATSNYNTYGALYNWKAAQSACPAGWYLPSYDDWNTLETYLIANGYNYDGTTTGNKIAKAMASKTNWLDYYHFTGTPGNTDFPEKQNASGFTALPAGLRAPDGTFESPGYTTGFWSTDECSYDNTISWFQAVTFFVEYLVGGYQQKGNGYSIRCIKDNY